jgi:tRNA nucleotidyltransferase (CCA-adding enzyme)
MAHVPDDDHNVLLRRFGRLPAARPLLERLQGFEHDVFAVGGATRDLMLETVPRELDLVVESELDPLLSRVGASARQYGQFGTATFELDGFRYDIARARRETYSRPGALPTVKATSIEEDLGRRDFTVNAIALGVFGRRRGQLIAADRALDDLWSRTLRVLHDASFVDDPTRLLRLVMYASRLDFKIEPHTLGLAHAALHDGVLQTVSGARVGTELQRLATEPEPVVALQKLHELGIDALLAPDFGLADPAPARRALALLPRGSDRATVVLAAAGVEVSPGRLAQLLDRLAFKAAERDAIVAAATRARPLAATLRAVTRPSQIAAAIGSSRIETVALAGGFGAQDAAHLWLARLRFVTLEIDGDDLLAAGVGSGPPVGAGLRAALAAKLDGRAQGRDAELAEALKAASAASSH